MPKLLLTGYLGCGNLGDDAILAGMLNGLAGKGFEVSVMSGAPEETFRNYGISSVPRMEMSAVKSAMESHDALVFIGGSIFQDASSVRSVAYYQNLVSLAAKAGKKVIFLGQGVGPLTSFFGKKLAAKAFNASHLVTVRDQASMSTLRDIGYKGAPRMAGDGAFLLEKPEHRENEGSFQVGNMKSVGISVRPIPAAKGTNIVQIFGDLCKMLYQKGYMPVLIEMDRVHDGPVITEIEKTQGGKVPSIRKIATPMEMQRRMMRMDGLIGMRLHSGILAVTVDMVPYMINYDPKVLAFANAFGLPSPPGLQGLTAGRILDGFFALQEQRETLLQTVKAKREEAKRLAMVNVDTLVECFRG
ncbi:MAG TPA: polysaccharide pyruvyl transferase family protein [Fimbriimonadaceae bacterium]|nr:polysaccharide pyruvyl transferase family protein [Fimbriimonadaceae bacterium]HRJ32300.1 polysaccharide pyruvyl transferase family protein [Fimbriimonadaceae bacterium]